MFLFSITPKLIPHPHILQTLTHTPHTHWFSSPLQEMTGTNKVTKEISPREKRRGYEKARSSLGITQSQDKHPSSIESAIVHI
jgi:hypothetical protein